MNYGGAKPVHAILFTPTDTIYCNILNENSDWLLIKRDDDNFTEKIRSNSLQNILISDLIKSNRFKSNPFSKSSRKIIAKPSE